MNEIRHQEEAASSGNLTQASEEVKPQPARRRKPVHAHAMVVALELVAGLLVGLAILAGAAVWRLSSGPVSLKFMTPLLEQAVNDEVEDYRIKIGETILTWAGWERAVDILTTDVQIFGDSTTPIVVLPEASVALSLRALLDGTIAATSVDVMAPAVVLSRDAAGTFSFGFSAAGPDADGAERPNSSLIEFFNLLDPATRTGELGFLQRLSVLGARVAINDQMTNTRLVARNTDLVLISDQIGTRGTLSSELELPDGETRISGGVNYVAGDDAFSITVRFADLGPELVARAVPELEMVARFKEPLSGAIGGRIGLDGTAESATFDLRAVPGRVAGSIQVGRDDQSVIAQLSFDRLDLPRLAEAIPEMADLRGIGVPVNGSATLVGSVDGTLKNLEFAINGGAGTLALPMLYQEPIAVQRVAATGTVTGQFQTVRLESAEIDLEDSKVGLSGVATRTGETMAVSFDGRIADLPWERVDRYWLPHLGPDARAWVLQNVNGGNIATAEARGTAQMQLGETESYRIVELEGQIALDGTSVRVLDTLPAVEQVDAVGTFGRDWLEIEVLRGQIDDIAVTSGTVRLTELDKDGKGEATVNVQGDLRKTLQLLDKEPFGFISQIGLSPDQFSGKVVASAGLGFPLRADLDPTEIKASVRARTSDVILSGALFDFDLTDGVLDVVADDESLGIAGIVRLVNQPVTVSLRQTFSQTGANPVEITASARADAAGLAALGLPTNDLFDGTVDIDASIKRQETGEFTIDLQSDLNGSSFSIAALDWEKAPDTPGTAEIRIKLDADGTPHFNTFRLQSGDLFAEGGADVDWQAQSLKRVDIEVLRYRDNDIQGSITTADSGAYEFSVVGSRLDVSRLIDAEPTNKVSVPISLTGQIDVLTAGPDRRLDNVTLTLRYDGQDIQAFILDSIVEGGGSLEIRYQPDSFGYALTVKAQDAGRALRSFDWVDSLEGGTLLITGHRPTLDQPVEGEVLVDNFRLVEAPIMARILQLVSLGLPEMGDKGLAFNRLNGRYCYLDGLLTVKRALATGGSIRVTAEGSYDVDIDRLGFRGTVGGASGVTDVIEDIPLLGDLLGGDEGIFAATYTVKGPADDPEIEVNEGTMLIPGAARNWLTASLEDVPHACGVFDEDRSYEVADPPD